MTNGTYSYQLVPPTGYTAVSLTGVVTVAGAALQVPVAFVRETYPVTFRETGLPTGATWTVTLSGVSNSSATTTVGFRVPNGTDLAFSVTHPSNYTVSPASGLVNVSGSPVTRSVAFVPFAPSVLSVSVGPGTVTLGGKVTVTANVVNGLAPLSYIYSGLPAGCTSTDASTFSCTPTVTGTFNVQVSVRDAMGRTATGSTTLVVSSASSSTTSGMSYTDVGYGLVAVLVIAAILGLLLTMRRRKANAAAPVPPPPPSPPSPPMP